ncbi:MAG: 4'-phosphopantetheinyl transferase superfamily protein [Lachnospiraceae bacterium]|nr:4'-phosphopantetheinyl transferase superfamily protein [Lachnospiraceae bacterium]
MDKSTYVVYLAETSNLNEEDLFKEYGAYFSKERLERIEKRPCDKARKELIFAGAVLSKALRLQGIDSKEFIYKENKKPYLKDQSIFFNLSHSGDYVGVAMGESEVGFDIQKPVSNVSTSLKKRILTDEETKLFNESKVSFNEIWAVKESYSKLSGEGISLNFKDISYSKEDSKTVIYKNKKEEARGCVIDLPLNYKASFCVKELPDNVNIVFLDL